MGNDCERGSDRTITVFKCPSLYTLSSVIARSDLQYFNGIFKKSKLCEEKFSFLEKNIRIIKNYCHTNLAQIVQQSIRSGYVSVTLNLTVLQQSWKRMFPHEQH